MPNAPRGTFAAIAPLIAAHEAAAEYFARQLHTRRGDAPRAYLRSRGFNDVIQDDTWLIGYAPPTWTGLTNHLRQRGFSDDQLIAAGLSLTSRRGQLIDRFRDRITFGIRSPDGQLVGFTGRAGPNAPAACPKYINSPKTAVYDKATVLYGLAEQRHHLEAGATPVLVEGPLDVLAVSAAGGEEFAAVSPCGTAISGAHAAILASYYPEQVIVAFDADGPGAYAAAAAYPVLARNFTTLLQSPMPSGEDPAATFANNIPLKPLFQRPRPLADQVIDTAIAPWSNDLDNAELRVAALRSAAQLAHQLRPTDIGRQVARIAHQLQFSHSAVTEELVQALESSHRKPSRTTPLRKALPTASCKTDSTDPLALSR